MKKILSAISLCLAVVLTAGAQSYKFDLTGSKSPKNGFTPVSSQTVFSNELGYGYDFGKTWDGKSNEPFFFSVNVPDGNYKVTVTLGSDKEPAHTTVRGEARRMYVQNAATKKGESVRKTFMVNKRNADIKGKEKVKLKEREKTSMTWDDKLTLEFNGNAPRVQYIEIEPADVPTIFLCGNSTVVDNDAEPYTGWGQMLPLLFDENVAIANYAESGLSANTFLGGKRLDKAMTQMKKGDYVVIEFGHNDQKQKDPGTGAYYSFAYNIKRFIDYAKQKGATPILVTPTRRRQFDKDGAVKDTHEDYPAAMREIAAREGVALVDFQELTKTLIEALGEENSKKLFVHYPMGTFEGQEKELKDNSHFSNFGAFEIAKIFCQAITDQDIPVAKFVKQEYLPFNPANPDKFESFEYQLSPFILTSKPAGN